MADHVTFKSACLWLLFIFHAANASQIASFINEHYMASQVIRYNPNTKLIMYSLCNSNSTPVFPANSSAAFDTRPYTPMAGTHISLTGYVDEEKGAIFTQLFFQEEGGNIVEEIFACDIASGLYVAQMGQQFRINDRGPAPRNQTDLSALLLGKDGGYQVYYQDTNDAISSLSYKPDERDSWFYNGLVNPLQHKNNSLSAGFAYTDNIHVVSCGTQYNGSIEVASQRKDKVWDIQTYPWHAYLYNDTANDGGHHAFFPVTSETNVSDYSVMNNGSDTVSNFPSLEERKAKVAVAFRFREELSFFYIGEDRTVHQSTLSNGYWQAPFVKQASAWPPPIADEPSADISAAYDYRTSRIWFYYMSNGSLTQVHKPEQDEWHAAAALPTFNATDPAAAGDGAGRSSGAKVGMGIGIGLGVSLLLTAIAVYFFHLRRSRRSREGEAIVGAISQPSPSHPGSPTPHGCWSNGQWVPGAYGPPGPQAFNYGNKPVDIGWPQEPVFELPHTEEPQEMTAAEVYSNPITPSSPPRG